MAIPRYTEAENAGKSRRGQVMIDFFHLNRDGLQYSRASWLLRTVLANVRLANRNDMYARLNLEWLKSESAPYSSCARSFISYCESNPNDLTDTLEVLREIVSKMEEEVG